MTYKNEDFKPFIGKIIEPTALKKTGIELGPLNQYKIKRAGEKEPRSKLYALEKVQVIGENKDWYRLKILGDNETYFPWVKKKSVIESDIEYGDAVRFIGRILYQSSFDGAGNKTCQFVGKIIRIVKNVHPYRIKGKTKDGWCDKDDIELL